MYKGSSLRWLYIGAIVWVVFLVAGTAIKRWVQNAAPAISQAHADDDHAAEATESGLRIECRNDDECIRMSESDWNDGRGLLKRKFLRVRIYNDSPRTAKECKVTLRNVTEVTPKGTVATDYEGPGLLIWSGDPLADRKGKSIRGNANPEVADLFYTVFNPAGDEIYLKEGKYSSSLKLGRRYNFEVIATAEGLRPVIKNIGVVFGSTWKDFEVVVH
jgi:hypothetical protein